MTFRFFKKKLYFLVFVVLILHSCSSITTETKQTDINDIIYSPERTLEKKIAKRRQAQGASRRQDTFFDNLLSGNANSKTVNQLTINPFLWQASLDVLSSTLPLASVDSNSGIIISDWYNVKNKNNERVKISVLVSTQELRADGIKVSIFKQILKSNTWNNTKIDPTIIQKIERKILKRAGSLANSNN